MNGLEEATIIAEKMNECMFDKAVELVGFIAVTWITAPVA
jgi:hypothetical protein